MAARSRRHPPKSHIYLFLKSYFSPLVFVSEFVHACHSACVEFRGQHPTSVVSPDLPHSMRHSLFLVLCTPGQLLDSRCCHVSYLGLGTLGLEMQWLLCRCGESDSDPFVCLARALSTQPSPQSPRAHSFFQTKSTSPSVTDTS